jgi:tetratricopeptide (TPR) repeat protein
LDPTDHAAHGRIAQLTVENSDVSRAERDLTHVDTAIALAPRVSRYRLYRLVLLRLLGRNGEMKQEMEAIASFESLSADEYRTLSIMHRSLRDNVSALHFAQLSVNAGPDGSIYHWELGEALSACGRHREAIEAVSTAIELEPQVSSSRPSVVDPILLRAEAYLYECEYDKALVDFETFRRKTVGTGRHRDRLWPGLGQALLNSGKCSETVVLLNEMQEEDPLTFASLCLNLAKHRRFPEELGIDLMLEWEQRRGNPPRPSSLSDILLGLALYLHSIHEGAPNERLLEECVSLSEAYVANPPSSRAHDAELGYAWHCVGQVAEKAAKLAVARVAFQHSVAVYESLTLGDSASAYSHYIAAIAALAAKDQTGYQRICRRMLERFRESKEADALDWTCWTLAIAPGALDRSQHGVELAKRAVTYVSSEDAVRNLGALYFRSGEYLSAQRELTAISSAESQRSAPAYAWYFLAMTEQQLGNRSAALEWFDKATQYREDVLCEAVGNPVLLSWNRELTLDVLHTEADALLRSTASPAK